MLFKVDTKYGNRMSARPNIPITKIKTTNILRYAGDIIEEKLQNMSTSSLIKCIRNLKQKCNNQQKIIKRLRDHIRYQQKKIVNLKQLLTDLRKNNLFHQMLSKCYR